MQLKASHYKEYQFTEAEKEEALTYNHVQVAYLQTLLSQTMIEKIALSYDPEKSLSFVQQEAELQGRISTLLELLQFAKET